MNPNTIANIVGIAGIFFVATMIGWMPMIARLIERRAARRQAAWLAKQPLPQERPWKVYRMSLNGAGVVEGTFTTLPAARSFANAIKYKRPYPGGGVAPVWVARRREDMTVEMIHV